MRKPILALVTASLFFACGGPEPEPFAAVGAKGEGEKSQNSDKMTLSLEKFHTIVCRSRNRQSTLFESFSIKSAAWDQDVYNTEVSTPHFIYEQWHRRQMERQDACTLDAGKIRCSWTIDGANADGEGFTVTYDAMVQLPLGKAVVRDGSWAHYYEPGEDHGSITIDDERTADEKTSDVLYCEFLLN